MINISFKTNDNTVVTHKYLQYFSIFYIKGRKECIEIRLILDIFSYLLLKFYLSALFI